MQQTQERVVVSRIGLEGMTEEVRAQTGRSVKVILKREACNPVAQGETFKQAAQNGTPFCEP